MRFSYESKVEVDLTEILLRVQYRYDAVAFGYAESERKERILGRLARREDRILSALQKSLDSKECEATRQDAGRNNGD